MADVHRLVERLRLLGGRLDVEVADELERVDLARREFAEALKWIYLHSSDAGARSKADEVLRGVGE